MSAWLKYLWYELAFYFSFAVLTFGFSLRVRGRQNIPRTGPVLLIANHQSFLDPMLTGLAAPRHLRFLARKTLWPNKWLARLIESLNAVPVDQEGVAKEGLQTVLRHLEAGDAVLIFPEGERTGDGKLHELRPGISLLIKRANATIVPVGLAGAFGAWPRSQLLPMPAPLFLPPTKRTIAVSVGPPLDSTAFAKRPREELLTEMFNRIQREVDNAEKLRRK